MNKLFRMRRFVGKPSNIWYIQHIQQIQQRKLNTIQVEELFQRKQIRGLQVISVNNKATIKEAAKLMEKEKIGAVMVEDNDKKAVGILTARDVQSAVADFDEIKSITAEFR